MDKGFNHQALINGQIVPYDTCNDTKRTDYSSEFVEYIGQGDIYSVSDIKQRINSIKRKDHFWKFTKWPHIICPHLTPGNCEDCEKKLNQTKETK